MPSDTMLPPLLDLNHVTVIRGDRSALKDLTLRIGAQEHVCILGPNGCGKSTLIKTITRECYPLARPGSSISILGDHWKHLRTSLASRNCLARPAGFLYHGRYRPRRGALGILQQHTHLSASSSCARTAPANRSGPRTPRNRPSCESRRRTDVFGEAKRTLIARALVHKPSALLFDEPGNTLDIAAHLQLREAMRSLAQSGLAILLVTHHVSEIIPEIDRVVMLKEGRIVADGPKERTLTAENLSALFGANVRLAKHDGNYHVY